MNEASGYGEIKLGREPILFGLKKVGGITVPLKFGVNAYKLLCEYKDIEYHQMEGYMAKGGPFAVLELSYFAYVTAMRLREEPTEIGMDAFIELAGEDKKFFEVVGKISKNARMWGTTIEDMRTKKKD